MTVGELSDRMSVHELHEWESYDRLEPFGDEWRQTGTVTAMIANVNRDPKKRASPYTAQEFMPIAPEPPPDVSADDDEPDEWDDGTPDAGEMSEEDVEANAEGIRAMMLGLNKRSGAP